MTSVPHINTVLLPAGVYPIGGGPQSESTPAHNVELAAFIIGETAVTNGQFAAFVAAGGYKMAEYWTTIGWRWQKNRQEENPAFWEDRNFNHDLQPVVGVCWYEAVAFTRWLCVCSGRDWRLLTEIEWEVAVRGTTPIIWPPFMPDQINSAELGIRRPWAAIGRGQHSWCGAYDLLGNIWEWTLSAWGRNWQTLDYAYPYDAVDGREDIEGSQARIMRGGSWFDGLPYAHPTHRSRYLPGSRGSNIGFRIACAVD